MCTGFKVLSGCICQNVWVPPPARNAHKYIQFSKSNTISIFNFTHFCFIQRSFASKLRNLTRALTLLRNQVDERIEFLSLFLLAAQLLINLVTDDDAAKLVAQ